MLHENIMQYFVEKNTHNLNLDYGDLSGLSYQKCCLFQYIAMAWWRHRMETYFTLLDPCEGNWPPTGGIPAQRPVTMSFDVFFDLRLNRELIKQCKHKWFETPSRSSRRHCNIVKHYSQWVEAVTSLNAPQSWIDSTRLHVGASTFRCINILRSQDGPHFPDDILK